MITLLGATGYTGQLVARELARLGLPLRLAGRSAMALEKLAATLPGQPPTLVVDIRDPSMLEPLADDTRLLISTAGPFSDLGEPVAALAARRGLIYLDTTNELAFVHNLYSRLDAIAASSGATLVPSCAFEVALADCAAAQLAQRLPGSTLDEVAVTYALPGMGSSFGTRASALRSLASSWLAYRGGAFVAARPGTASRRVRLAGVEAWALAFPSSETAILPAHLALRDVSTWMVVSRAAAAYGPWLIPAFASLLRGPFGPPLGSGLRRLAERAAAPPSADQRAAMRFSILVEALRQPHRLALTLQGHDPYGLTARIVGYNAAWLLEHAPPPGVQPPAAVIDPQALLQTLSLEGWLVSIPKI